MTSKITSVASDLRLIERLLNQIMTSHVILNRL